MSKQNVDIDALVLSALDARTNGRSQSEALHMAHGIAHYLTERGVEITLDGEPIQPGTFSPLRFRVLVAARGLLDDAAGDSR